MESMHFSKCLTKANIVETFGWVQLAGVCFQGQTLLRNTRRNSVVNQLLLLQKSYWMKCFVVFFFLSISLIGFQQRRKDLLQQAHVWLLHCKRENSRMKSASLFFLPLGSLFPKSSCTYCLGGVCMCPHAHGGNGNSITLSGACISHQVVLTEESQLRW